MTVVPLPRSLRDGDATEVAEALAQLVRSHQAVPTDAIRDLRRLLSHDLARRDPARLRIGHLKLLMEMLSVLGPDVAWVSQAEYMRERERRTAVGEAYPDESTLRAAYGKWVCAVRAASRFLRRGGAGRVPGSYDHCRPGGIPYTVEGIQDALLRCRADLGEWPTEWEYHEWAAVQRLLSAQDPRLPGAKPIRKCFASFAAALQFTQDQHDRTDIAFKSATDKFHAR